MIVWTPSRETMYPLSSLPAPASSSGSTGEGMLQDVTKQRGAFVEVKGWGDVLEGASRRESFALGFFRLSYIPLIIHLAACYT